MKSLSYKPQACLLALLFFLLLSSSTNAQSRKYIKSHEYMANLEQLDPTIASNRAALETTVQQTYTTVQVPNNPVIPVIFHILYANETQRISEAQINAQIDALNRDFGLGGNNFNHESFDQEGFNAVSNQMGIQFCLPQLGGDSSAVNYYPVAKTDWAFDNAMKDPMQEGVAPWDPKQFLNVYVVNMHDTLAVSGFAQMPGAIDATDGIVIDYQFVGNAAAPHDMGRTLVHLVGNWMGLYSIWGESPCDGVGDRVSDTPPHNSPNFGCPNYQHLTSCSQKTLLVEQTMNFMDSSDDACLSMWTTNQKYRFYAYLQAARGDVIKHNYSCQSTNLAIAESTPVVAKITTAPTILSNQVKVYPNPGNDYVQLTLNLKEVAVTNIRLTDLTGRTLFEKTAFISSETIQIQTADWLAGIYLLSVSQKGKVIHSEKIAIQH